MISEVCFFFSCWWNKYGFILCFQYCICYFSCFGLTGLLTILSILSTFFIWIDFLSKSCTCSNTEVKRERLVRNDSFLPHYLSFSLSRSHFLFLSIHSSIFLLPSLLKPVSFTISATCLPCLLFSYYSTYMFPESSAKLQTFWGREYCLYFSVSSTVLSMVLCRWEILRKTFLCWFFEINDCHEFTLWMSVLNLLDIST
jgi:hypothetical protein